MRRLYVLTALTLGVLLFAAPAAWACGELIAMTSECPMAESMVGSMCSGSGPVSMDCCVARPAPEPMQSLSMGRATHLVALEPVERLAEQSSQLLQPPVATPAGPLAACDLGRYTLFSSFLL